MNKAVVELYSTEEAGKFSGATKRMLQWWDEEGIVSPLRIGHKRFYTAEEVTTVANLAQLRKRGVSLHRARQLAKHGIESLIEINAALDILRKYKVTINW